MGDLAPEDRARLVRELMQAFDLPVETVQVSTTHDLQPGDTVTLTMPEVYPQVEDQHQRVRFRDLWSGPSSGWRAYLWLSGLKRRLYSFLKKCLETNRRWMNRDRDEITREFIRIDALEEDARQSNAAHFQAVHNYTDQEAQALVDAMRENRRELGIEASRAEDAAFLARLDRIHRDNARETDNSLVANLRRRQGELVAASQAERNRLAALRDAPIFSDRVSLESQSRHITLAPEQLEIGEIARDARTGRVYLRADNGRIEELIRGPVTSNEQAQPTPPLATPTEAFKPLLDV